MYAHEVGTGRFSCSAESRDVHQEILVCLLIQLD